MMDDTATLPGAQAFTSSAQRVVDYLNRATPIANWSVSRVTGGEQVHLHVHDAGLISAGDRVDWDETFCRRMVNGAAPIVRDSLVDADYSDLEAAQFVRSYAGVPIRTNEGELFGVLCGVKSETFGADDDVDRELLSLLSEMLSSQLTLGRDYDLKRREAAVALTLASTDYLTGLLNRRGWETAAAEAQGRVEAYGDQVAVAVIDLDGLKQVNDTSGHGAGDALLKRAAAALSEAATGGDTVIRYGGDEFVVIADGISPDDMDAHFSRFADQLRRHKVPASLGYAAALTHQTSLEDAFKLADSAMYEHKRAAS
ncbi:MAG: hypothetical protein JWP10_2025 [Nocardioidaceae bacterium]|nr:hypothetical protein [Nocardioidaceae bacterium]